MTHVPCDEVITELWDFLDGELPVERAALIADHLAECARCYPQYRFEYAFLAAVARQRARGPGPSPALIEKVAGAVLAQRPGGPLAGTRPQAAAETRRPAPRAAPPLRPRGPALGTGAAAERWALALLRASLGVFLLFWGIGKLALPAGAALVTGAAMLEVVLAACILLGVGRRWSYGAALGVHVVSLILLWGQLRDPWDVALAGLPVCGALVTLYLLRDRDRWTLDAWLAWRRPWRVVR
jgi:putative oxidoreductase